MHAQLKAIHATIERGRSMTYAVPARPFDLPTDWDLDSTPAFIKSLSRAMGTRTPTLEAAIVLASLGHDIRYYYGGSMAMKQRADQIFADEIKQFSALTGGPDWAGFVAGLDKAAVNLFGGAPFLADYSWSYGLPVLQRGWSSPSAQVQQGIQSFVDVAKRLVIGGSYRLQSTQTARINPQIESALQALFNALRRAA